MTQYQTGDHVGWRWANGLAQGVVREVRPERVEINSKGKRIVRNGSVDNPVLIIDHRSGNSVIKLASEVQKTS